MQMARHTYPSPAQEGSGTVLFQQKNWQILPSPVTNKVVSYTASRQPTGSKMFETSLNKCTALRCPDLFTRCETSRPWPALDKNTPIWLEYDCAEVVYGGSLEVAVL